ncbi:MAG: EF-hand domain-containing protein [Pseudomonadota bacterium]
MTSSSVSSLPSSPLPASSTSARQPESHSIPATLCKPAVRTIAGCSFAAAALLAGAALPASAQTVAPATPPAAATSAAPASRLSSTEVNAAFDRADENHDARLDRTEAVRFPAVAQRFEQIDSNRDSYISREEFTKAVMGSS